MASISSSSSTLHENKYETNKSSTTPNFEKLCLLDQMEISVTEAEKRANSALNIREYYTVYLIETKVLNKNCPITVKPVCLLWRRYTEFEQLRAYLEVTYLWGIVPPLPEKRPLYTWHNSPSDTFDPDFVDRRRAGLENFLHRIALHPVLSKDPIFLGFLQQEDGWKESLKQTGYLQQTESKLRTLSINVRQKCLDPNFEDIKTYANGLHNNLSQLLRVRARLAARLFNIHKLHQGYGRVFSEWSAIEQDMGDGLQKSGHFFDSIAAGIGASLEEEELIADQLKEYFFYAGALQGLCRRREALQYEVEQAEDSVQSLGLERVRIQQERSVLEEDYSLTEVSCKHKHTLSLSNPAQWTQAPYDTHGRIGLMSRLFGSVEPEEVREQKLIQLEARMQSCEQNVEDNKLALSEFAEKASREYDSFQQKKARDLKETMASYISLQIKMAKKGLQTWTNIKQCIENIP